MAPAVLAAAPWPGGAPVADAQLAQMRGGFVGEGFRIDFSLESVVRVNGELRARTVLQLPLGHGPARGAATRPAVASSGHLGRPSAGAVGRGVQLVQNGAGNAAQLGRLLPGLGRVPEVGMIVQNTLDNQTLQTFRILNVDVAGAARLQSIGAQRRIDAAIVQSLR